MSTNPSAAPVAPGSAASEPASKIAPEARAKPKAKRKKAASKAKPARIPVVVLEAGFHGRRRGEIIRLPNGQADKAIKARKARKASVDDLGVAGLDID